jgi:hypothetical protein
MEGNIGRGGSCNELALSGGVFISCVGEVGGNESLPYIRLVPLQMISIL